MVSWSDFGIRVIESTTPHVVRHTKAREPFVQERLVPKGWTPHDGPVSVLSGLSSHDLASIIRDLPMTKKAANEAADVFRLLSAVRQDELIELTSGGGFESMFWRLFCSSTFDWHANVDIFCHNVPELAKICSLMTVPVVARSLVLARLHCIKCIEFDMLVAIVGDASAQSELWYFSLAGELRIPANARVRPSGYGNLLLAVARMETARALGKDWHAWYHAGGIQFPAARTGALTMLRGGEHCGKSCSDGVKAVLALITPGYRVESVATMLKWLRALGRSQVTTALERSRVCDDLSMADIRTILHHRGGMNRLRALTMTHVVTFIICNRRGKLPLLHSLVERMVIGELR
jgi:hypothetical protein